MPQFLHKDVKDLITRMLVVDPSKRITITQIKEHPWFKSNALEVPKNMVVSYPVVRFVCFGYNEWRNLLLCNFLMHRKLMTN